MMEKEFRRLAVLRKFMAKSAPQDLPDFGRAQLADWIRRQAQPIPGSVSISVLQTPNGRHFKPGKGSDKLLIYIHGGGLVYYDTEVFTPFLANLANRAGCEIVAPDYPKAPETSALNIYASLSRAIEQLRHQHSGKRIALAGDSVGAFMALLVAEKWSTGRLQSLHLIYPVAKAAFDRTSPYGEGHFLDTSVMEWFQMFIAPLWGLRADRPSFSIELPPTVIHVAECDILAAGGLELAGEIQDCGHLKTAIVHKALPHDFCLYEAVSPGARSAIDTIAAKVADSFY